MKQQFDKYCSCCGMPGLRSVSIKTAATMLDVSSDFIRDHIRIGTISTIALNSTNPDAARQPLRIRIHELSKLIEERPGVNELVENALSNS